MQDRGTSIEAFLSATAARQPTPGGGAITALTGALSAAIGEMVVNYSLGKKGLEAFAEELKPAAAALHRSRELLLRLMVEDQSAFEALQAARKMPVDAPDRQEKLSAAMLACVATPEAVGATGVAVLELCDRITNFVNPQLLSDLAICADLAMATVRCSMYNCRANLHDISDPDDRRRLESSANQLLTRAASLIQRVAPRIWERVDQQG